jgi:hypothetical protein
VLLLFLRFTPPIVKNYRGLSHTGTWNVEDDTPTFAILFIPNVGFLMYSNSENNNLYNPKKNNKEITIKKAYNSPVTTSTPSINLSSPPSLQS